jgi:membrane protein implicated in regulation of membrane protease activity
VTKWTAFGGVGVAIVCMLVYALNGELDLPAFIATAYAGVGLWLGLGFFPVWVYAAALLAAAVIYLREVRPMYRAWHGPDPDACRKAWKKRGDEAAATVAQGSSRPRPWFRRPRPRTI